MAIYIIETYWTYLLLAGIAYLTYRHGPYYYHKIKARNNSVITEQVDTKPNVVEETLVNDDEKEIKGDNFEKYVVDRFPKNEFTLVEWTTDMMRKHHRYVEADTRPDLKIRHNLSGDEFYVECKYRSYPFEHKVEWSNYGQIQRYKGFAEQIGLPVYVVIGLGGTADFPKKVFCVPLEDAKYPGLYVNYLQKYYHDPRRHFSWNDSILA